MSHAKKSSIDIIKDAVEAMTFPVEVNSVTDNGDGTYTIDACNILHAQTGFNVTILDNSYKITAIDAPNSITVKGTPAIPSDLSTFNLYTPFFFYGTPLATDVDLQQEIRADNKTPMVWMLIPFDDHFYNDIEEIHDRDLKVKLYFLTQGDANKNLTADSYLKAVNPMRSLLESFVTYMQNTPAVFDMTDVEHNTTDYPKFGVYITMKGVEKRLFADDLAGVELSISVPIFRSPYCDDCGNLEGE